MILKKMKIADVKKIMHPGQLSLYLNEATGKPLEDCCQKLDDSTDDEIIELYNFVATSAHEDLYKFCKIVKENRLYLYVDLMSLINVRGNENWVEMYEAIPSILDCIRTVDGRKCFRFRKNNHYKVVVK